MPRTLATTIPWSARASAALAWVWLAACSSEPSPLDLCGGVDCSGKGRCVVFGVSPFCHCDDGAHPEGLACVNNLPGDPCAQVDCSDHGECTATEGGLPSCLCEEGFLPLGNGMLCLPHELIDGDADADGDGDGDGDTDGDGDGDGDADGDADGDGDADSDADADSGWALGTSCDAIADRRGAWCPDGETDVIEDVPARASARCSGSTSPVALTQGLSATGW